MRKFILYFLIIFSQVNLVLADTLYVHFDETNSEEILLLNIQKITYSDANMNVHLKNGSLLSWNIEDVHHFKYNLSENNEEEVSNLSMIIPESDFLQAYPNPSNGVVFFQIDKPATENFDIEVYDLRGSLLDVLFFEKGKSTIKWDKENQTGVVFFKCRINDTPIVKKIILN